MSSTPGGPAGTGPEVVEAAARHPLRHVGDGARLRRAVAVVDEPAGTALLGADGSG